MGLTGSMARMFLMLTCPGAPTDFRSDRFDGRSGPVILTMIGYVMYVSTQMTKLGYLLWFLVKEERKQRKDRFEVEFEIIQEGATQNQSLGKFLYSF